MAMPTAERSFSSLLDDALGNLQALVSGELRLAKAELREEVRHARSAAMYFAVAAAFGIVGFSFLLLGAVFALSLVVPPWLAAVIVGATVALLAGVMALVGRNRIRQASPPMERTVQSTKETLQWAKQPLK